MRKISFQGKFTFTISIRLIYIDIYICTSKYMIFELNFKVIAYCLLLIAMFSLYVCFSLNVLALTSILLIYLPEYVIVNREND